MKLDATGVKISLEDWLSFDFVERSVLCHLPADTEDEAHVFVSYLDYLSRKHRGRNVARTAPLASTAWDTDGAVPAPVAQQGTAGQQPVSTEEWTRWKPHQRYALYKTALSKNDPEGFFALLRELRESRS
jgi:hypothetical protein